MDDPDMGAWSYVHNAFGELVAQTDAKGQVIEMRYDALGRLVERSDDGDIATPDWTWTYDTASGSGTGKLRQVDGPSGYQYAVTYDALGRVATTTRVIATESFTVSQTYDSLGRPLVLTYPKTGFKTKNHYTATGYLEKVTNDAETTTYWRAEAVDAEGRVTEESLGNGLTTLRTYDPARAFLTNLQTGEGGGTFTPTIQDLEFAFDPLGNLLSREDFNRERRESFEYDSLNRLRTAQVLNTATSVAQPQKSTSYDEHGNIDSRSDVAGGGTYQYGSGNLGGYNDAGPHAVTGIVGGNTYTYDDNGNLLTVNNGTTDIRTVGWTVFNKPAAITIPGSASSTFLHDHERARIQQIQTVGADVTVIKYVGGLFEQRVKNSGAAERVHYIRAGDTVAIWTDVDGGTPSPKLRYLHRDHLGSVESVTDNNGVVIESLSYDA